MGFVHDSLADGRQFRILTVVDNWSRLTPILEAGFRMSGETVGQAFDRALNGTPGSRSITGPNFDGEYSKTGRIAGAYSSTSFDRKNT